MRLLKTVIEWFEAQATAGDMVTHPMWIYGLPRGFEKLGHKVKICATDQQAARTIRRFKPNLCHGLNTIQRYT